MSPLLESIVTLALLFFLLWRKNSHNAFFWGLGFQWLAINIKVFYAEYLNLQLEDLVEYPEYIIEANRYSNIGLLTMAFAIYLLTRNITYPLKDSLNWGQFKKFDRVYLYYSVFFHLATPFSYTPALQQVFVYLTLLKFGLLFIAVNQSLAKQKKSSSLIYVIILFEVLLSFTGYFSGFKEYIYVLLFVLIYRRPNKVRLKDILKLSPIIVILIVFGIVWSAIKMEYREYISGGQNIQSNVVGTTQALSKLSELVSNFSKEDFEYGLDALINRISYIEFFSATISNVPIHEPHTNGSRLFEALIYGLQPRLIFPDKVITDDSEVTKKYTGISVSGKENATSISLGYMADGYVDFGHKFFWITPLVIGLLLGISYRYLYNKTQNPIWALAITFPFFEISNFYGQDSLKVIPPIIYYTIVAILFQKFIIPILDKNSRTSN